MINNDTYHFFWGGPFSNWHPSLFYVHGVQYNCVEQYMMAQKARIFNDQDKLSQIMSTDNPRLQKSLGRKVANFNENIWGSVSYDVVFYGCWQKFHQNGDLRLELLKTGDTIMVEASPYDRLWGIGYDAKTAIRNRKYWGENRLGNILTEIKAVLLEQN